MYKKILITGYTGQLGSDILTKLSNLKKKIIIVKKKINFENIKEISYKLDKISPDIIINCAAYTNTETAEKEKRKCNKINHLAVSSIAKYCKKKNKYLIHISTDYIFNGKAKKITKNTLPRPLNYYGLTKLKSENCIKSSQCRKLILRIGWIYSNKKNNFPNKIIDQIKNKNNIYIYTNEIGSPTSVDTVSKFVIEAIRRSIQGKEIDGVYNLSCTGKVNRVNLSRFILNFFQKKNKNYSKLKVFYSKNKTKQYRIKRPKNSVFDLSNTTKTFNILIPNWKFELKNFLYKNY
jgi:dTDP-4-dehydrorhamnose reductase